MTSLRCCGFRIGVRAARFFATGRAAGRRFVAADGFAFRAPVRADDVRGFAAPEARRVVLPVPLFRRAATNSPPAGLTGPDFSDS